MSIAPNTRFGHLTVLREAPPVPVVRGKGVHLWTASLCRCDCGRLRIVPDWRLRTRHVTSYGCRRIAGLSEADHRRIPSLGTRFGALVLTKLLPDRIDVNGVRHTCGSYRCDCGRILNIDHSQARRRASSVCRHSEARSGWWENLPKLNNQSDENKSIETKIIQPKISVDEADIDMLRHRLIESETRCSAFREILEASGIPTGALRADAEDISLVSALAERRAEYPPECLAGRTQFDSFARRLLYVAETLGQRASRPMEAGGTSVGDGRDAHSPAQSSAGKAILLKDVTVAHVETLLGPCVHPGTYNSLRRSARAFFRWCVKRRLLRVSPAAGVEARHEPRHEPRFYDAPRVRRIFEIASSPDTEPGIGVFLTLGFFCGMRTSEILRATAGDVDLSAGTVRVPIPKGYRLGVPPRLIEAQPNAVAWLRRFLPSGLPEEAPIAASRRAFGEWKRRHLDLEGLGWGQGEFRNVMRHTACTMHMAAFRNLAETQLMLGHSRGSGVTVRHYLGLATREEGLAYWNILP